MAPNLETMSERCIASEHPSVSFTDCPTSQLQYVISQYERGQEVIAWLKVKLRSLIGWKSTINQSHPNTDVRCIDYLNLYISGNAFKINRESKRLEDKLIAYSHEAIKRQKVLNRRCSKSQRENFSKSFKVISIFKEDIISVEDWKADLETLEARLELVQLELSEWKKKHNDLEKKKEALFAEILEELEKCKTSAQDEGDLVLKENEEMKKYIKRLERDQTHHVKGTPIPQLQSNQDGEAVKVKLSGDEAHMSRVTNFILFSFSILQSVDDLLSSKGRLCGI